MFAYGLPPSGAMDQYSFQIGNILVGNPRNAAALEATLKGLKVQFLQKMTIALTGADSAPRLNRERAPLWQSFRVEPGDSLTFGTAKKGLRSYLCVHGGLKVQEILGSRSTFVRGNIGSVLKKDDTLETTGPVNHEQDADRSLPARYLPEFEEEPVIRVLPGPQVEYFTEKGLATFYGSTFRIGIYSDRQACRTEGPAVEIKKGPGIITDPIPTGSIQIPGDGLPIILLRDCQITGGYAKIAVVAKADLDRVGQMKPGDKMRFKKIDRAEGLRLWREYNDLLNRIENSI
jgi:biotin-dependent carboxylase-like uncharacterized protein